MTTITSEDAAFRLLGAVLACDAEAEPDAADYDADVLLASDAEFELWRLRALPTGDEMDADFRRPAADLTMIPGG